MHITSDVQKKMRRVELYTRRLLSGSLVGSSRSALKGIGFEFDQIRDYTEGDDVRAIDWRASARMNTLLVKQYIEERSRTIIIVVDASTSMLFGKKKTHKYDRAAWIASILALIAQYGSDRVGCIIYDGDVRHYIPPGSSLSHARTIMHALFSHVPHESTSTIAAPFKKLLTTSIPKALVFVVSDFIDATLHEYLAQVAKRHDVIAIRCLEREERTFVPAGFIAMQDTESGECGYVDTRSSQIGTTNGVLHERIEQQNALFKRCNVTCIDNREHDSFIGDLIGEFRRRMRY